MVDSYLSTKFGINLLDGFWENAFHERMDDGRMDRWQTPAPQH